MSKLRTCVGFVFLILALSSGGAIAHHERGHKVGLPRFEQGIAIVPLRIAEKKVVIPREGCTARGDCDLKEIVFFEEDDEFPVSPDIPNDFLGRNTTFMSGIATETVAALKNYLFVQFIRGCMWNSKKEADGSITTMFGVKRDHLGKRTHFVHREWTVDSTDRDPAYSSEEETGDRHYFLEWSDPRPKWIPGIQQKLLGERTPKIPFGFVTDSPQPMAQFLPKDLAELIFPGILESAVNKSLEFKMCLYHTRDVPLTTDGTTKGFGPPIACHEWRASHVYDHVRGAFTSPKGIHQECGRPFDEKEKKIENSFSLRGEE